MTSTVTCLICGHVAVTLARHLKASHAITADGYREKFPGARLRSEECEAHRRAAITKAHAENPRGGHKKTITCSCGVAHEVGLTSASRDVRCPTCKQRDAACDQEAFWSQREVGRDYVVCVGCMYRAENLTSHVQNAHPEWVGCYPGQMVAECSAVRDKSALKGRLASPETRAKMSANAGRWNAGLTKDTDTRVQAISEHRKGQTSWSKGLTKNDHPSLRSTSEKLKGWRGGIRYWSNNLSVDLADVDFTPFLDETGAVDRKTMSEDTGVSEVTLTKYMEKVGLRLSTKYVDARAERATIRLERSDLERFTLINGKVVIAQAMIGLGRDYKVVRRECDRHGLPTFNRMIRQTLCLDAVSKALGGTAFEQEWRSADFVNPWTGHRFRFDGYFPSHDLLVEFHGYQHWTFPSVYIKQEGIYAAMQERDRIKENLVHDHATLRYFLVRENEPYADVGYIRGRLMDEGILDPG